MKKQNIRKVLKENGFLIYSFQGTSMLPLLKESEDKVHLKVCDEINLFDVVLFEKAKTHFTLHRVIDIKGDDLYIIGDNSPILDIVNKKDIVAKMVGYYKKDKYFDISCKEYKEYLSSFLFSNEENRELVISDSKGFFKNRLKEAYREIIRLAVLSKIDTSKIDILTQNEKLSFFSYVASKKALPYLGLAIAKYGLNMGENLNKSALEEYETSKMRLVRIEHAKAELSKALEVEQIPHTFLKGSETRYLYPAPFLRTSNDIDLLVSPEYFAKAKELLIHKFKGKFFAYTQHDESYVIDSLKMDVELHHHINTDLPEDLHVLLEDPIKRGVVDSKNKYLYHLTNEDQLVIALSHSAKHVNGGEFWITMLLDIYFLNQTRFDKEILNTFRLNELNDTILHLCDSILKGNNLTEDEEKFEDYLLKDRYETYIALEKGKYSNKFSYIMHRVWLPIRYFKPQHPILNKLPILLPVFEIQRWFRLLFKKGKFKKAIKEVDNYNKQNEEEINILNQVGLKEYIVKIEKHNSRF